MNNLYKYLKMTHVIWDSREIPFWIIQYQTNQYVIWISEIILLSHQTGHDRITNLRTNTWSISSDLGIFFPFLLIRMDRIVGLAIDHRDGRWKKKIRKGGNFSDWLSDRDGLVVRGRDRENARPDRKTIVDRGMMAGDFGGGIVIKEKRGILGRGSYDRFEWWGWRKFKRGIKALSHLGTLGSQYKPTCE